MASAYFTDNPTDSHVNLLKVEWDGDLNDLFKVPDSSLVLEIIDGLGLNCTSITLGDEIATIGGQSVYLVYAGE